MLLFVFFLDSNKDQKYSNTVPYSFEAGYLHFT